jgi:hypothetical protein
MPRKTADPKLGHPDRRGKPGSLAPLSIDEAVDVKKGIASNPGKKK